MILRYITDLPTDLSKFEIEEDRQIYQELRSVCTFSTEFEELKLVIFLFPVLIRNRFVNCRKLLIAVESPVCFTHNDFQPGNILRLKSQPDTFTVIDFEYCSYNYR